MDAVWGERPRWTKVVLQADETKVDGVHNITSDVAVAV